MDFLQIFSNCFSGNGDEVGGKRAAAKAFLRCFVKWAGIVTILVHCILSPIELNRFLNAIHFHCRRYICTFI